MSVEGGKASQPLQFSFTFYDLDGHHHGKITKDVSNKLCSYKSKPNLIIFFTNLIIQQDIAGIVYTIYESIGKSVVVPYCGSKTINVRLTVSPDANTAAASHSSSSCSAYAAAGAGPAIEAPAAQSSVFQRRYKYRSRKLIPTEEEPATAVTTTVASEPTAASTVDAVDSHQLIDLRSSTPEAAAASAAATAAVEALLRAPTSKNSNPPATMLAAAPLQLQHCIDNRHSVPNTPCKAAITPTSIIRNNCHEINPVPTTTTTTTSRTTTNGMLVGDHLYESIPLVSAAVAAARQRYEEDQKQLGDAANYSCRECSSQCPLLEQSVSTTVTALTPFRMRKILRKSRSRKAKHAAAHSQHHSQQNHQRAEVEVRNPPMRARSLSVGNENCCRSVSASVAAAAAAAAQRADGKIGGTVAGQSMANNNDVAGDDCLNNMRRNDLIDIIRESMEKNRMCFQSNGYVVFTIVII